METQEKEENAIGGPETDESQKAFLEKLKSFFCFCLAKKNKDDSRLKKSNSRIKRSKNETQNPVISNTAGERFSMSDELQKTFLGKLNAFFSSITEKMRNSNYCLKKSRTANEIDNLTDEPQKTFLEKMKSFFCFCTTKKNQVQKPDKSLRTYIKQNWKWVVLLLVIYIITFGAVVSAPIIVSRLRFISQNETEQERFETRKNLKIIRALGKTLDVILYRSN